MFEDIFVIYFSPKLSISVKLLIMVSCIEAVSLLNTFVPLIF